MMDKNRKGETIGIIGALMVHIAVIALLILISITVMPPDDNAGGMPVMLGNTDAAHGFDDPSLVDVDILDEEEVRSEPQAEEPSEQDMLTQDDEETVALTPKTDAKKEPVKPKEPVRKSEKSEAEKAAEMKKAAEAKIQRERKAAEEAARKKVAGAFGKGSQMGGNKGTAEGGVGVEGSKEGNSLIGAKNGVGGMGTFSLGGRSLGRGSSLPKPVYNIQEEGRVVVNITVNSAGKVIGTSINPGGTNTVSSALRKSAEEAARKAVFNEVEEAGNQTGTITYYFNLK